MSEARNEPSIRIATDADLGALKELWGALYEHQAQHGMLLTLPATAFESWTSSIVPFLGRFAVVAIAEQDRHAVGFAAGRVRVLPPYFGSGAIGTISEVYVRPSHQGGGVGRRLLAFAVDWFAARQIARIELQVVAGNPDAIRFYERLGWRQELVQMVWQPAAEHS